MDPISGVASVLTLVQVASDLTRATSRLCSRLRNVPKEIQQLRGELEILQLFLKHFATPAEHNAYEGLSKDFREALLKALASAQSGIAEVETVLGGVPENPRMRVRVKWISKDRKRVNELMEDLAHVRGKLETLLQLMTFKIQSSVEQIKRAVVTERWTATNVSGEAAERRLASNPQTKCLCSAPADNKTHHPAHHKSWTVDQRNSLLLDLLDTYHSAVTATSRTPPCCPSQDALLLRRSLRVPRPVNKDHPFLEACGRGSKELVRELLQDGLGTPNDVDETLWTPLAYAIRNGSMDAVEELLASGADIEGKIGIYGTSPLQWAVWSRHLDMTRMLLRYGASQEHVNDVLQWNVTFFCWPAIETMKESTLDFLLVLDDNAPQDLDAMDNLGWTVLHRVAAHGLRSDVLGLIELGADPLKVAFPLEWNALHYATAYGNEETFECLLPHFGTAVAEMIDARGWTLLHIAADVGNKNLIKYLLTLGADVNAVSKPYWPGTIEGWSGMPESLFGRTVTPQEVATVAGLEELKTFLEALREYDSPGDGINRHCEVAHEEGLRSFKTTSRQVARQEDAHSPKTE